MISSRRVSDHRARRAIVVAFVCCAALALLSAAPGAGEPGSRSKAPDFTAKDLSGKTVKLADLLKDGPVLVDFWTTWCKPCKNELPELDRIHRTYRDRGFKVVAISEDDPKTVLGVKPLVNQKKWEMLVLTDTAKDVGNAFSVRSYPTSFLISRDGTIVHFAQGYMQGDEKQLESKIVGLLGGETGTASGGSMQGSGASK